MALCLYASNVHDTDLYRCVGNFLCVSVRDLCHLALPTSPGAPSCSESHWFENALCRKGKGIYLRLLRDIHDCAYSADLTFPLSRWVPMQSGTIDPTLDLCTRYPLRLGGPMQCGTQTFPDTATHEQHWESNPRPSDLGVQHPIYMASTPTFAEVPVVLKVVHYMTGICMLVCWEFLCVMVQILINFLRRLNHLQPIFT